MHAYFAGVLATFRERGVDDDFLEGAEFHREEARRGAPTDLRLQTEFHYAMQLITMLPEIQQRSLELRTLPLLSHASGHLLDLLQEATRAHLLGLHTASLALCRAALEKALQERVPTALINAEHDRSPRRGDLEVLIDSARNAGLLDSGLTWTAHHLRRYANGVLHGNKVVTDSASAIGNARLVIDRLFAVPHA